jgi:uncharacterized protein YhfF
VIRPGPTRESGWSFTRFQKVARALIDTIGRADKFATCSS